MSDAPSDLRPDALELLRNSQLVQVRTTRLDGEVLNDAIPVETLTFNQTVEFSYGPERYFGRYYFAVDLFSSAGDNAAKLSCTLVAQWLLRDGYRVKDQDVVDYIAGTVGYMAVYPYARAILQQQATELGFGSLLLGTVEVGQHRPAAITLNGTVLGTGDSNLAAGVDDASDGDPQAPSG